VRNHFLGAGTAEVFCQDGFLEDAFRGNEGLFGVDDTLRKPLREISTTTPSTSLVMACPLGRRASNSSTPATAPAPVLPGLEHVLDALLRPFPGPSSSE